MRYLQTALFVTAALGLLAPAHAAENTSAAPNGVKLTKYIIGVADLDKAYAFYHALGIESERPIGKPAVLPDGIRKLVDVPAGTKFRNTMAKIPGADFALEMTEFSGMDLKPGRPKAYDPGGARLILIVRDVNAALEAAKKAGGEVVTIGGAPLGVGPNGANKAVFVKDPDSFYVELLQPATLPQTTAPASSNVIGARFASGVADAAKAAAFYKEKFGMEAKVNDWDSSENLMKAYGLTKGQRRTATVTVPGTTLAWTFYEFKGVGTTSYKLRIPDPGAPAFGFEVRDIAAGSAAMKANGGAVITTGDGRMQMPTGDAIAFTRDPNGILVELAQTGKK
jgi:catechol 2,3-dioxygenase-like lactoylglutathione lyase family enzyme